MATVTYYLLRKKGGAVGDGPYLGFDAQGQAAFLPDYLQGKRFLSLEEAENECGEWSSTLGECEIEIRNLDATPAKLN